jgi:hypothetical protein
VRPPWDFSSDAVRAAYRDSAWALVDVARRIPPTRWEQPGLGVWTIRDLVGHAGRALSVVEAYLDAAADTTPADPGDAADADADRDHTPAMNHPLDYYLAVAAASHADPAAVAERGRQAGRELGEDPAASLAALAERVVARVDGEDDAALVLTPFGVMTLAGYLPSRVFELTVHRLDAVEAAGIDDVENSPGLAVSLVVAAGIAALRHDAATLLLAVTGRHDLPGGFSVV